MCACLKTHDVVQSKTHCVRGYIVLPVYISPQLLWELKFKDFEYDFPHK